MILLAALVNAPLCAISKRWPRVVHAAERSTITAAWPSGTVTAACGARGLRLLVSNGDMVLWPPTAKSQPLSRCRSCWELTGRKRPRSRRSLFARRP